MPDFYRITRNVMVHRRDDDGNYQATRHFLKDDIVDLDDEWAESIPDHSREKVSSSQAAEAKGEEDDGTTSIDVTGSTVDKVLEWVNDGEDDDEVAARAQQAMAAETSGGRPRTTLIAELRELGAE